MKGDPFYIFYFQEYQKKRELYGEKTLVFMKVGKFYEAYHTKTEGYLNLYELENLLQTKYIKRNDNRKNNRSQLGIQEVSIYRHLRTLVENGYTVVLYEQSRKT